MTKTFRDAWKNREKVVVNGHEWEAWAMNPGGTEVVLLRYVKVKDHWSRNRYHVSSHRTIAIRRPADATIS